MKILKPNEKRAQIAITLIRIVLAVQILSLISGLLEYNLIQTLIKGETVSPEAAQFNDLRESLIGLLYLVVFIISTITFIQWFRRAYYNLHIKVKNLNHSEGWAAGSWFVPIISLYRPYQIMEELYEESQKLFRRNLPEQNPNLSTKFLGTWWALWIINGLAGQFVFRYAKQAVTLNELSISSLASMASDLIGIPLAFITIKVIKDYAKTEKLLHLIHSEKEEATLIKPKVDLEPADFH